MKIYTFLLCIQFATTKLVTSTFCVASQYLEFTIQNKSLVLDVWRVGGLFVQMPDDIY